MALLVIDVQNGFDDQRWGHRNNPRAEENISLLLDAFRSQGKFVFHVKHDSENRHSPLYPGQYGNDFKTIAQPLDGEAVFIKHVNSAFLGTELQRHLTRHAIDSLLVVGLTTDHCVSTTVRMGANLGYRMTVAANATATFDRQGHDGKHYDAATLHDHALVSLHNEFATIIDTATEISS